MGNFRRGAEAAQEAAARTQFSKIEFFGLKDKEVAVVRFLTQYEGPEAWLVVQQHNNISTRGAPPDYKGEKEWPAQMSATCRRDPAFKLPDGSWEYPDCFICSHVKIFRNKKEVAATPSPRTWALACIREEVIGDGSPALGGPEKEGKRIGYKDAVRTVAEVGDDGKPTGNEITEKRIVVVNMGWKNFFANLEGPSVVNGTCTDRDFRIQRKGSGQTDTDYSIAAFDPIDAPVLDEEGKPVMETVGKKKVPKRERLRGPAWRKIEGPGGSVTFELSDPGHPNWETRYHTEINLEDLVSERASDEYFARFFDTRVDFPPTRGSTDSDAEDSKPVVPKPSNDADPARQKRLRDRVMSYAAPQGADGAADDSNGSSEPTEASNGSVKVDESEEQEPEGDDEIDAVSVGSDMVDLG